MTLANWLKGVAAVTALVAAASVYFVWRGNQRERAQLKAELLATQKALTDADVRRQSRNAQLAQLNHKKATIQNPAQIVTALPDVLPLPSQPTQASRPPRKDPSSRLRPRPPRCSCLPKT